MPGSEQPENKEMKVEQEQLNRLVARARTINNHLLEAMMRLQKWRQEGFYDQLWEGAALQ